MSKYSSHLLEKQKMKLKAATAKPERPRFSEQANIAKDMFGMDEHFNSQIRNEDDKLSSELSRKWEGNGGGTRGDAFISGLQSGMRKKSILDDKERMAKYKSGMEKLYAMVERQNQDLYQQEKLASARQAVMPNWMAYSQSFRGMSPADREQSVESMIQKYNDVAGTSYRRGPVDAREPWKVTVVDGDQAQVIDLMDLMKTPEEMRIQIMMQSPEYRQMEQAEVAQQDLDNQLKLSLLQKRGGLSNGLQGNQVSQEEPQMIKLPNGETLDVSSFPAIRTAAERNKISKTYNGMSKVIRELQDVYDEVVELEQITSENEFSAVGSRLGGIPNKIKDWAAKGENSDSELNKEVILRNKIESRFQQLQPVLEQYLKGAAPDSQLLARMHEKGVYPETNQSFPVIKSKLEMLLKTATEDRDIAGASLSSERQIPFLKQWEPKKQETKLTPEEADIVSAARAERPGQLDKFTDAQVRDWAKSKGLL